MCSAEAELVITNPTPERLVGKPPKFDNRGFFKEVFRASEIPGDFKPVTWTHLTINGQQGEILLTQSGNKLVYPYKGYSCVSLTDNSGEKRKHFFSTDFLKALWVPGDLALELQTLGDVNEIDLMTDQDNSGRDIEVTESTKIKGLYIIKTGQSNMGDALSMRSINLNTLRFKTGVDFYPVQGNHSLSIPGVIRAIHGERWRKLVWPREAMYAAIVDINKKSPTFRKQEEFNFDGSLALLLDVALGNSICANGKRTLNYMYLVDSYYTGQDTRTVKFDDPTLAIDWPVENPIMSDRDKGKDALLLDELKDD